ncbi:MAG: zinc-dependent alcohol dehydrogenase [Acidimicrobiales bacterium]
MRALVIERSVPRFAAARLSRNLGPLRLTTMDEPELPGPGWQRVQPLLAGICGSDLATVSGRSSRWFEPIVSFPFVPGHEVVGRLDDGCRVVLEPVLACAARAIVPACPACARGDNGNCERIAFGHLRPGLQTGYCADTGGGWSDVFVAHDSQLHVVPDDMSDEAAVLVEPTACAVHAVESAEVSPGAVVAVIGAGTLGLCTVAALRHTALASSIVLAAKHPDQRRLGTALGADIVVAPSELGRTVRRRTQSLRVDGRLTGGADVVIDCVGREASLEQAIALVRPRGRVVLVGMPGPVRVDLTPLWQREIALVGSYAYRHATYATAFEVVAAAGLHRLLSARYPLERFADALDHAAAAGRRGAVKVAFDLRDRPRGAGPKKGTPT